ncbi:MAG: protease inhibitor I42 family protein [Phycisphaerales bacterium]|nr:protease inhibitor I42 family protein [Phycisphaerales bacterium]
MQCSLAKSTTIFWILTFLAAVCLHGCGSGTYRTSEQGEIVVGLEAAGTSIELRVGQVLLVQLPDGRVRGRVWQLIKGPNMLILRPDDNRFSTSSLGEDDEEVSVQELRFVAEGEGEQVLSLALVRPGAGLSPGDDRWLAEVLIR